MANSSVRVLIFVVVLVAPLAYTLEFLQPAHTSIIHNSPSAVSHQTFTRLSASPGSTRIGHILTPTLTKVLSPLPIGSQPSTPPSAYRASATITTKGSPQTPIVETLTRTPAHLTYAATPIVYQMLPQIKPVRSISYESLRPGPRAQYGPQ